MKTHTAIRAAIATGLLCVAGAARAGVDQLLKGRLDLAADTITLPLYEGALKDGRKVWYILTDTSSKTEADRLGIVYAPELASAIGTTAARTARWGEANGLVFDAGTVDFSPTRSLTPGAAPHPFPPTQFQPGSVADQAYSPFAVVQTDAGPVAYNAPMLAFDIPAQALRSSLGTIDYAHVHDHVVSISPDNHEVTVKLSHGFAGDTEVVYLSFDSNNPMAATMEASTYAPALDVLKGTLASLSIYAVANGQTGADNPQRQGFDSALSGDGSPLNVLDFKPDDEHGYSPLWDLHLGAWTDAAIQAGDQVRLTSSTAFINAANNHLLTGPQGGMLGSTGILINCPVVAILPGTQSK